MAAYSPAPTSEVPPARAALGPRRPAASTADGVYYPQPGPDAAELDPEAELALPMMQRGAPYDPHASTAQSAAAAAQHGTHNTNADPNPAQQLPGMEDQPAPTGFLAWAGFGCTVFSLMALCIAFASPYWWATWPNSFNTFLNIGLWEVCFRNYMHHKDDSQEIYDGCWWVFSTDKRYWKLREWLLPPWFITCQVIVTGCLLIQVAVCVLVAMIFLHCCPIMNHEYHQTYGMFSAAALLFLSSLSSLVVGIIYGIRCQDREWMPRPDLNLLSWGYGFFIISGIVSLIAGALFFLQARKVHNELMRREDEFIKAAIEASGFPSQSQYSIDPGYNQPGYSYEEKPAAAYDSQPSYDKQSYHSQPSYEKGVAGAGYAGQPSYDKQPYDSGPGGYDSQPSYDKPGYASQPSYEKPGYTSQPSYDPDYSYDTGQGQTGGFRQ